MKWYSDFVFWKRNTGDILATESLLEGTEREFAQKLANEHKATVSYAKVCEYFVEPQLCPQCGEPMPQSGPCWHNLFEEEEQAIPFQGEPMPNREIDTKSYYGV